MQKKTRGRIAVPDFTVKLGFLTQKLTAAEREF